MTYENVSSLKFVFVPSETETTLRLFQKGDDIYWHLPERATLFLKPASDYYQHPPDVPGFVGFKGFIKISPGITQSDYLIPIDSFPPAGKCHILNDGSIGPENLNALIAQINAMEGFSWTVDESLAQWLVPDQE